MTTPELTPGITGPFEVVSQDGLIGKKGYLHSEVGIRFVLKTR